MESIIKAIELVRAGDAKFSQDTTVLRSDGTHGLPADYQIRSVPLKKAVLEERRIVSHTPSLASRSFDMLRTHVLKEMDKNGWQFLAVTSPTSGCGKSTIACNLAMSLGRLTDRAPLLVDMDLKKPSVARYLGLRCDAGIIDVLRGAVNLNDAFVNATLGPASVLVLPGNGETPHSSDWMASQAMMNLLQTLRRDFRNRTVIFDMPPVLDSDDVISILPRMDATLLVAASGSSTIEDVQACRRHLQETPVVRVVVNKVPEFKIGETKY